MLREHLEKWAALDNSLVYRLFGPIFLRKSPLRGGSTATPISDLPPTPTGEGFVHGDEEHTVRLCRDQVEHIRECHGRHGVDSALVGDGVEDVPRVIIRAAVS